MRVATITPKSLFSQLDILDNSISRTALKVIKVLIKSS